MIKLGAYTVFFLILSILTLNVTWAQDELNQNAMVHKHENCILNKLTPEQKLEQAEAFRKWRSARSIGSSQIAGIASESARANYTIPVVVHIFETTQGSTHTNVPAAIAALNRAFDGSAGVDTRIQFCLAQRAPDGGITSGVNRIKSGYKNFDMDMEDAKLKSNLQWDPRHYLNIWVVDEIYSEISASYTGRGGWDRTKAGGYATLPGGTIGLGATADGIVVQGLGAGLLAHEIGHYLGLFHTFEGGCANGDCTVNGDMVCDTPPDNYSLGGCGQNSCKTDTLSNYSNGFFPMDVPDMTSNFMDYSSCGSEFTAGQVDRMHFHLDNYRSQLDVAVNSACTKPCNGSSLINYITPSDTILATNKLINFASNASGVTNYEWYVERVGDVNDSPDAMPQGYVPTTAAVGTSANLDHTFTQDGKYRIYLKAWDASNPSCFASYSQVVRVTCDGVDARFWPNKRLIASKQVSGKFLDNVVFTNLSQGATSYEWTVTHEPPNPLTGTKLPDFNSTVTDLDYTFPEPGTYQISLEAQNGACTDEAGPFTLEVLDPTMNGIPRILRADCYKDDSIKVRLRITNTGYDTVNIGTPVTFYDEDPRNAAPTPSRLTTFLLDKPVYGFDSPQTYDVVMLGSRIKLDQLYVVFNDSGTTSFPIAFVDADEDVTSDLSKFPPSGWNELSYNDNFSSKRDFQFELLLAPPLDTACAYSDYPIQASTRNDAGRTIAVWTPATDLSCSDCLDPILSLKDQQVTKKLLVTSDCGCTDSATVIITTKPYDAPLVTQPPEICQFEVAPDLASYVNGQDLTWYAQATGGTGSGQTPVIDGNVDGLYEFWVSQTLDNCEGPREKISLLVKPAPLPTLGIVPDVCFGADPPDLAAAVTGNNLLWYGTATGGTGQSAPPAITTDLAGTFQVWITQTTVTCESPRAMLTYTIVDLPVAPAVTDTVHVCLNDPVPNLADFANGTDLQWYTTGSQQGSIAPPTFDTSMPTYFNYTVTQTVNGCEGPAADMVVQVNSLELSGETVFEVDEGNAVRVPIQTVTLPNEFTALSVEWKDASGQVVSDSLTLVHVPLESTTYLAEVTTAEGCVQTFSIYVEVIMRLRPAKIFTPNGDASNEVWNIGFLSQFPAATVTVYNRWGNRVFERKGYQNNWRGDHNGSPLPVGTYYYVINLADYEREAVTGSLTIMR